jgi:hypothetical protein
LRTRLRRIDVPDKTKPEKIVVGTINWNNTSQSFDVSHSAQFGIATAGENAGFTISTTLSLANGTRLGPVEVPIVQSGGDEGGTVTLRPTSVPYDREAGAFSGSVDVTATSQLLGPNGESIGGASTSTTRGIIVGGDER